MRGRKLSTSVVILSFCLFDTLECHFETVIKQDYAFYIHRSFSSAGKVCFSSLVVSKEASMAQKANKVMKCLKVIHLPEQCSKETAEGYVIEHDFIF